MRTVYKRRLSERAAARCENAVGKYCFCRCGGVMHGISHREYRKLEEKLFSEKGKEVLVLDIGRAVLEAKELVVGNN